MLSLILFEKANNKNSGLLFEKANPYTMYTVCWLERFVSIIEKFLIALEWMEMKELKELKENSVFVNGFAEAAPTRAKQGKDSYMLFPQKKIF